MGIKLLHLNIQGTSNIERVSSFIEHHLPDVCCLQEVFLRDITNLALRFGYQVFFSDMDPRKTEFATPFGVAILSRVGGVIKEDVVIYTSSVSNYGKDFDFKLLGVEVKTEGNVFHILTTHLPVNYPGHVLSQVQLDCFGKLKIELEKAGQVILTGDFNSPRGLTSIFDTLAVMYKDNVPGHIDSTIDPVLHREKGIKYVVDGMFSAPSYKVSEVEVFEGVSDHKAIMAQVSFL